MGRCYGGDCGAGGGEKGRGIWGRGADMGKLWGGGAVMGMGGADMGLEGAVMGLGGAAMGAIVGMEELL